MFPIWSCFSLKSGFKGENTNKVFEFLKNTLLLLKQCYAFIAGDLMHACKDTRVAKKLIIYICSTKLILL